MQQEICPRGRVGLCAVTYNKRRHVSHFRRRCIECARFFSDAFKPTTNYVKNTNNPKKQWFASHSHLYSSTVNNSTVPITSWPLMSANSSLTAHYVREVKGTCGNWTLFTSIWPCECRQLDVCSDTSYWPRLTSASGWLKIRTSVMAQASVRRVPMWLD